MINKVGLLTLFLFCFCVTAPLEGKIDGKAAEVLTTLVESKNYCHSLSEISDYSKLSYQQQNELVHIEKLLVIIKSRQIFQKYGLLKFYTGNIEEFLKEKKVEWGFPANSPLKIIGQIKEPFRASSLSPQKTGKPDNKKSRKASGYSHSRRLGHGVQATSATQPKRHLAQQISRQTKKREQITRNSQKKVTSSIINLYKKAFHAYLQQNDSTALFHFDEMIRRFPQNPRGYYWSSVIHKKRGELKIAAAKLRKAILLQPSELYYHKVLDTLSAEIKQRQSFHRFATKTAPIELQKPIIPQKIRAPKQVSTPIIKPIAPTAPSKKTFTIFPPAETRNMASTGAKVARPFAIMIENHRKARPQSGLIHAPLVYEMPVEGRITRFMAIFQDTKKDVLLGPVRSARHYFVHEAKGLNAIYYHCGGSPKGYATLHKLKMNSVDEIRSACRGFFRDKTRRAPHNLYIHLAKLLQDAKKRKFPLFQQKPLAYLPQTNDISHQPSLPDGKRIAIRYRPKKYRIHWEFDPKSGNYLRYMNGKPHRDRESKKQISAKNIIVLKWKTRVVDKKLRIEVENTGKGEAHFFINGRHYSGFWVKKSMELPTRFYLANGNHMKFLPGKTWVQVTDYKWKFTLQGTTTPPVATR